MNIGIDIGGTNIRGAVVSGGEMGIILTERINASAPQSEVVQQVFAFTEKLFTPDVESIGIGVPGMVNEERGLIFDVVNIPSWKELPLKQLMEERFSVPVYINNDANCFVLAEYYYGSGKKFLHSTSAYTIAGVAVGTGLGTGIIINGKLYAGKYCGAGEFGMIDYLDHSLEYYASGQFFRNVYDMDGEEVFEKANSGDIAALRMFSEFGDHVGAALKTIMYALEADLIIIGGSVKKAWPYFQQAMWKRLSSFGYKNILEKLVVEVSAIDNAAILGAAALQYNHLK